LHRDLDLGLIFRLVRPGRDDGNAIVCGELAIARVDIGLVAVGFADRTLQVIRDYLSSDIGK